MAGSGAFSFRGALIFCCVAEVIGFGIKKSVKRFLYRLLDYGVEIASDFLLVDVDDLAVCVWIFLINCGIVHVAVLLSPGRFFVVADINIPA